MAGLLSIGTSAIAVFKRALDTTGNNIANSDTVGYSRQRTEMVSQAPELIGKQWVGAGVRITEIKRLYDDFLATSVRDTLSANSALETYNAYASRVDNLLVDPAVGLDTAVQDFFNAVQTVADNPTSVPTRQQLLVESQSLVDRFHDIGGQFEDMRRQVNQELANVANEINSLADSFAELNRIIVEAIGAASGGQPNDLLDQRERLLKKISALVDVSAVPQDDGAWNLFVGKGQALVMGASASKMVTVKSARDPTEYDVAFQNGLGTLVITDQLSGGEIGGLLTFKNEILDPAQNQLGLVAVGISERINAQHQLGLDLHGNFGGQVFDTGPIQVLQNSNNTSAAGVTTAFVDTGNLTASDYELRADAAANEFTLRRLSDGQAWSFNTGGSYPYTYPPGVGAEQDGFSLTISGAAAVGDRFLIRPTREASESMTLEMTDPRLFAAAAPVRAQQTTNAVSLGPNEGDGVITQPAVTNNTNPPLSTPPAVNLTLEWDPDADGLGNPGFIVSGGPASPILYDPATEGTGKTFTFAGVGGMDIGFTVSGTPRDGDRFVIETNTNGVGDNRNALALAQLQTQNTLLGVSGGAVETATFQEAYGQLVSDVGAKTYYSEVNMNSSAALLERHEMALSSISGVNLDEEAANLVKYQQAYQAAAQTISVAQTLFDTLIGVMRR